MAFIDGFSGLPESNLDDAECPCGLPINTQDDSGGPSRVPGNTLQTRGRLSRLPERIPDNTGRSRQAHGNLSGDSLSGVPEKRSGKSVLQSLPQEQRPDSVTAFLSRRGATPGHASGVVAGGERTG